VRSARTAREAACRSVQGDPVGIGLAQPGQVLEVFASSNGSWTMVMTMPDGKACLIAAGDNCEMVTRIKGSPI
jgi:hypothetical protein